MLDALQGSEWKLPRPPIRVTIYACMEGVCLCTSSLSCPPRRLGACSIIRCALAGRGCDVEMKQEIPDASGEQPSGASQGTAADCRPSTKTNVQRASNGPKGPQARIPDRRSAPRFNRKFVPKYKFDGGPGQGRVSAMFLVLRWPRHLEITTKPRKTRL